MRRGPWVWCAALALAASTGACSAIVREFELTCEDDCRALNEQEGLGDEACFIYQCRTNNRGCEKRARDKDGDGVPDALTCRGDAGLEWDGALDCDDDSRSRRPGAAEDCNGLDDDCNGVIDEGTLDGRFTPDAVLMLGGTPASVAFGVSPEGPLDLVLRYADQQPDALATRQDAYRLIEIGAVCQAQTELLDGCDFHQIAIASTAQTVIAAGVNLNGCGTGQVRLGASFDRKTFTWQHTEDSDLRFGADTRPDDKGVVCDPWGVSQLSAALLHLSDQSQGLVLWREIDPRLLAPKPGALRGIAFDLVSRAGKQRVITANAERSVVVSDTPGRERAALVSWPASGMGGYFMAYDAQDSVELAFVPPSPASAAFSERLQRGEPILASNPRGIALALDPRTPADAPDRLGLAAAWREGTTLQFAPITYDPRARAVLQAGDKVRIADAARLLEGPVLVYQQSGFRSASDAAPGGWYVLWLEQESGGVRLLGSRVAQADFVSEAPFLVNEQASVTSLFAYPSAGPSQLAYVGGVDHPELYIGSLGCRLQP